MDQDRPGFTPPQPSSPEEPLLAEQAPEVLETHGRRRRISTGVVVAAVGIGALGVAGAAYAAAADPSPSATGSSERPSLGLPGDTDGDHAGPGGPLGEAPLGTRPSGAPDGGMGMRGGPGMRGAGMGIHGEFVVPKTGGGYQTVQMQRGEVTAVSASSISVKSEDGFSATYDVTSTTRVNRDGAISDITVGAKVVVLGVKGADGVTADRIADLAAIKGMMGDRDGDGPGGVAPSASAGSTT